ncbi:hypothetical protein COW36_24040 [bacterium (Candidatus Blackallbacteria) CG17_big_fil_post_rev_8_21_14_2_50_48_46]|uniref:Uncharacterized protein n=1 Tax=bacterium (Candidatus Blackallbacteria) CG17_big_fil_post_rev_8_21_14_2_50_48_46 TaxID=2014261 RepID=A0A2M7FXD7_9BACT|nr:MAG: hypothetical protein COW64_18980 [bacterium (Candidatus Blackallbacteria) CG18_big_fil_WC_8_21_14_2_50_49_26]PIW13742.1 MAG: hypothetical protein COW36_24040 [bacterium (Candidatus Blackallbacteria) CG17_big_fil_post_rev_8_21_14_2_50_48_46]PIW44968.1 MAG: hypothetical protein COW20_21670 [bacterium (Candidatus Blackallbacteria) CG13_big_fil_rev_8_21_14_2_50_49_14]
MQNTKIQTLWNLCTELKEKRQFLVERLKHTQDYLDEQQWHLSREVHLLRGQTHALAHEVETLQHALHTVHRLWAARQSVVAEPSSSVLPDFYPLLDCARLCADLNLRYQEQAVALATLQPEVMREGSPELFQEGFQELNAEFQEQFTLFKQTAQEFANLQEQALTAPEALPDFDAVHGALGAHSEFLNSFSEDTEGFQTQWQASVPYREPQGASQQELEALQQEVGALRLSLHQQAEEKESREKLLAETYAQAYASAAALAELQSNHDDLAGEMEHLMGVLNGFQETIQQKGGAQSVSIPAPSSSEDEDEETDLDAESPESDRQAIREAVQESSRKRIAQILKKRFSKVPRRVHNLLKKIEVGTRLDKLFDLALECESIEQFSEQLEENAA